MFVCCFFCAYLSRALKRMAVLLCALSSGHGQPGPVEERRGPVFEAALARVTRPPAPEAWFARFASGPPVPVAVAAGSGVADAGGVVGSRSQSNLPWSTFLGIPTSTTPMSCGVARTRWSCSKRVDVFARKIALAWTWRFFGRPTVGRRGDAVRLPLFFLNCCTHHHWPDWQMLYPWEWAGRWGCVARFFFCIYFFGAFSRCVVFSRE